MSRTTKHIAIVLVAAGTFAYCAEKRPVTTVPPPPPSAAVPSTVEATPAAQTALPKAGPKELYPNPAITPGVPNPAVTQANIAQTVCASGWTGTVRPPPSYTNQLKVKQIQQYGFSDTNPKNYEEDHFISLELGGDPRDPRNLWPEPYNTKPVGAKNKDTVENALHKEICAGTVTLQRAQEIIVQDWYACYLTLKTNQACK